MRSQRMLRVGLAVMLGACGGSRAGSDGGPMLDSGPRADADAGSDPNVSRVEVMTTAGPLVIELHRDWAPQGVDHVHELIAASFYDGCRFFRVVPGFVVQFGINGDPTVNDMWRTRTISDDRVVQSNTRGFVSYAATSAPNSRTTQLFINLGNNAGLDASGFAPIGEVISGMTSVDAIDAEYGDMPDQGLITMQGNAYLDTNFPNLDHIDTARLMP